MTIKESNIECEHCCRSPATKLCKKCYMHCIRNYNMLWEFVNTILEITQFDDNAGVQIRDSAIDLLESLHKGSA